MAHQWRGVLREYADRLDVSDATPIVTLGEGGTPLVPAHRLSQLTGGALARLQAITPKGYEARIDITLTDEWPTAQALVINRLAGLPYPLWAPALPPPVRGRAGRG